MIATTCTVSDWHGCYDDSWKGVIVEEAFAHPAKFAFGLISRIVDHGLREGYWSAGDLIGDCFGGVALGGVICGARGINWVGCELEPRFVELGGQNLAKHGPLFMASGATSVKLLQGDSRQFASVVGGVAAIVTSPPYEGTRIESDLQRAAATQSTPISKAVSGYGTTDGNIGNDKAESYWQAMRLVYEQCHLAIRPGGVMAVVVKDFVKAGQRVRLCDQTCELLESVGFEVFERTRCHLVKVHHQPGLFGEDVVKTTSRKSFFRRLAEKNGSPEINYEEVIWARSEQFCNPNLRW